MLLELGLAVGGGVLNALSGSAQDREIEKRKQQALALLRENIIDPKELDTMLTDINRLFNSRLVSTLNSTAIRSRGVVNSGVVKGVVAGQIEGARLGTLTETRFKTLQSNQATRAQMANVETTMGPQHDFLGDFASGALTALPTALEGSKYFSGEETKALTNPGIQPITDTSMNQITSSNFFNMQQLELPKLKLPNVIGY